MLAESRSQTSARWSWPKNPLIAKFFVEIGYADTLGSGVRYLYK